MKTKAIKEDIICSCKNFKNCDFNEAEKETNLFKESNPNRIIKVLNITISEMERAYNVSNKWEVKEEIYDLKLLVCFFGIINLNSNCIEDYSNKVDFNKAAETINLFDEVSPDTIIETLNSAIFEKVYNSENFSDIQKEEIYDLRLLIKFFKAVKLYSPCLELV